MVSGQDPLDPNSEVDPDRPCNEQERVLSLISCKDNCRGGKACYYQITFDFELF